MEEMIKNTRDEIGYLYAEFKRERDDSKQDNEPPSHRLNNWLVGIAFMGFALALHLG